MGSVGVHLVLAGPEERIWVWEIALLKGEAGAHPIAVSIMLSVTNMELRVILGTRLIIRIAPTATTNAQGAYQISFLNLYQGM